MSKSLLAELAETLCEQEAAVEATKAKMLSLLTIGHPLQSSAPKASKKPTTPRKTTAPKATSNDAGEDEPASDRQPSLKEVVLSILEKGPADLRGVVEEVNKLRAAGEYKSKAKKMTPVVSQALFQLKQEALVAVEKSADNRNLYSLSQSAS